MLSKALQNIGLSEKEALVYLNILELGQPLVSSIAHRTGVKRVTVYAVLNTLKEKGLVSSFEKDGVNYFSAVDPEVILNISESNIAKEKFKARQIAELVPELKLLQRTSSNRPKVKFFEGVEGIKAIYEDTLNEGKEIYAFLKVGSELPELNEYFHQYVPRRAKLGIKAFVVASDTPESRAYQKLDQISCRETFLIPGKKYPFETEVQIFGDKVAFSTLSASSPIGVLIESTDISKTMKGIFDLCHANLAP